MATPHPLLDKLPPFCLTTAYPSPPPHFLAKIFIPPPLPSIVKKLNPPPSFIKRRGGGWGFEDNPQPPVNPVTKELLPHYWDHSKTHNVKQEQE